MPSPRSLIHTYPLFKLQGVNFIFCLVPTSERFISCIPSKCELSPNGIPYPQLAHLAQSLLDTQHYADLEDLVDGMNLSEEWGEQHLQLDHVPHEYIVCKNELIREALPGSSGVFASLCTAPDARRTWTDAVRGKVSRMVPKCSERLYATRFRLKGDPDPREDRTRQV